MRRDTKCKQKGKAKLQRGGLEAGARGRGRKIKQGVGEGREWARRCGDYPGRGSSLSRGLSRNVLEGQPRGQGGQIAGERWDGFWISLKVEPATGMRWGVKERGVDNDSKAMAAGG